MSGKIVCLLCILFCLGACSDDRFSDSDPAVSPSLGEAVPVSLALDVAPLLSPLSGTTRIGAGDSGLQASFSGMEVELSGTPVVNTRGLPALDESGIYSVVILQFDGTTPESKCVQIKYIAASGGRLDLTGFTFRGTQAPISRIVVIANLNKDYFNETEWGHTGNKTYQDLLNYYLKKSKDDSTDIYPLFKASDNPVNRALMFGMADTKIETGKLVTVVLQRIFAKASFNIEIAQKLKDKYSIWQAQLSNQPGRCYLVPAGREKPFPSSGTLGDDGYYNNSAVKAVNGVFNPDDLSAYIPVNLQPEVHTATEQTRTLVAPIGSTYLQIMGLKMTVTGNIEDQVIYQVYLGSNFTTDYTISSNTFYRYTIRVKDDNPQDGTIVKFIPGYWGGELKAYDENGAVVAFDSPNAKKWRYEKEIEVYPFDVNKVGSQPPTALLTWGPKLVLQNVASLTDGRKNTWNIHGTTPQSTYEASYACYNLNSNVISSENDLTWYQPSIAQLVGTYLVCSNLLSTLSAGYWSSTASDVNNAYFITKYGEVAYGRKDAPYFVRAVKDLIPANK